MVSFAVVLFFSVTGTTLNHPTWFASAVRARELQGSVPLGLMERISDSEAAKGTLIRAILVQQHLHGAVDEFCRRGCCSQRFVQGIGAIAQT